ncbi:MAG: hypothetical protein WC389_20295 [Lutibacter sp.]|jgi:hypothetical protein
MTAQEKQNVKSGKIYFDLSYRNFVQIVLYQNFLSVSQRDIRRAKKIIKNSVKFN